MAPDDRRVRTDEAGVFRFVAADALLRVFSFVDYARAGGVVTSFFVVQSVIDDQVFAPPVS